MNDHETLAALAGHIRASTRRSRRDGTTLDLVMD